MAKEPPYQDKKDKDASTIKGKYGIPEEPITIDVGGGVMDRRATGIYKNLGSIRSTRTGYTILSCLGYVTQAQEAVFYLPFPDSIFVPAETSWSENSEEGLAALAGAAGEAAGQASGNVQAGMKAAGQSTAKFLADYAPIKAALRSAGKAYNPNNQMYFNGVNFSGGTFTFKLVPKNAVEAMVMYSSARCILALSLPGGDSGELKGVLGSLWDAAKNFLMKGGNEEYSAEAAAQAAKYQEEVNQRAAALRQKLGNSYVSNFQPAFFSYPPLWDISFHIPTTKKDKTVFEWRRLALENVRLDLGSGDLKWHDDGMPVSVNMTLQVKETVLKYAGNIEEVMPVIII